MCDLGLDAKMYFGTELKKKRHGGGVKMVEE